MVMCHTRCVVITFGHDPVRQAVQDLLTRLDAGEVVDAADEGLHVDLKLEKGRKGPGGVLHDGPADREPVAQQLMAESACMANTPGGGALIVGVADDGQLVGATTDAEWLRHRIYELTQRMLTVDISEIEVRGHRLLVLLAPAAVEPIRVNGKIQWRVDDHCVEIDAATWHSRRMRTLNYDWSAEPTTVPASEARPGALAVARDFLAASGDPGAEELARASDGDLLRRLNAVTGDGLLTNAGVLSFVGRGSPAVDYVHRDHNGGDSTARINTSGRSLLEELAEVFTTMNAHNDTRHVQAGLVVRQVRDIPQLAAREAIVNGVAHREWGQSGPTFVEHIGRTLRVTSPGGFYGGVNPDNIITHPSQSRNAALTQLLADLRVAEREGIGVDRMVREMVRVGHAPPDIREITGPFVRTSLVGDALDESWMSWLGSIEPPEETADVSSLLILRRLVEVGWVDTPAAARLIQLTNEEARGALLRVSHARVDGHPLIELTAGVPEGTEPAWHVTSAAREALVTRSQAEGRLRELPSRTEVARSYAAARGRISSTELASLVGASPSNVGGALKALAAEGVLEPSSPAGRGRGFFYRWTGGNQPQ